MRILILLEPGEKRSCELAMRTFSKLVVVRIFFCLLVRIKIIMLWVISGVESPSVGNFNTISTRARVHHTVRIASYCVVGAGCLLVPTEDEALDDYTVVYGSAAEQRTWSGRGKVQELDLRRKHAEYLKEMLPKFNRLRRGDGT